MKLIITTVIICATAITCVVLLRGGCASEQPRYQLYSMDETSAESGATVKSVYRVDTVSGRTWRISSTPFDTGTFDAQHKPVIAWADAWEEMPESTKAALAKEQASWQQLIDQHARRATEPAQPSVTPP